ncbi:uncharacterized protein DUF2530 [Nocardioides albertanoniae]|uniref:Uncharacterized protein DUF2530 n=1 Tax=Nocardioides albertanoniae TaxID=1175486 RepID=A0A543A3D8_9ACTN|nr:DUF2530 domain-containing protein [Nocardioides albertanoniae]TQL67103.1 uncharacterized protein DUF2530 [Nocardioides albertanoniae]
MNDQWRDEDYSGTYPEQHYDAYEGDYYAADDPGYAEAPPEPKIELVDEDGVRAFELSTLGWLVAFVALLPFWGLLSDRGWTWWVWTCLAAFGIGAIGIEVTRRRRARRMRN